MSDSLSLLVEIGNSVVQPEPLLAEIIALLFGLQSLEITAEIWLAEIGIWRAEIMVMGDDPFQNKFQTTNINTSIVIKISLFWEVKLPISVKNPHFHYEILLKMVISVFQKANFFIIASKNLIPTTKKNPQL